MDPQAILSQFGFDEKESVVYMAALELGMAPTSIIARKAKLKRPTTHEILKKLCARGFAERFLKNKMRYYSVISPRALYEQYQGRMQEFEQMLPSMMAMYNTMTNKPKITFYEGKKDLERLYLDSLNAKDEALNYFMPDKVFGYFTKDWGDKYHIAERVRRGIKLRVIMSDGWWVDEYKEKSPRQLRTFKVINDPRIIFTNEVYIYNNRMSMFSFEEDFGILIESDDVIQTQRSMFELAWTSSLVRDP